MSLFFGRPARPKAKPSRNSVGGAPQNSLREALRARGGAGAPLVMQSEMEDNEPEAQRPLARLRAAVSTEMLPDKPTLDWLNLTAFAPKVLQSALERLRADHPSSGSKRPDGDPDEANLSSGDEEASESAAGRGGAVSTPSRPVDPRRQSGQGLRNALQARGGIRHAATMPSLDVPGDAGADGVLDAETGPALPAVVEDAEAEAEVPLEAHSEEQDDTFIPAAMTPTSQAGEVVPAAAEDWREEAPEDPPEDLPEHPPQEPGEPRDPCESAPPGVVRSSPAEVELEQDRRHDGGCVVAEEELEQEEDEHHEEEEPPTVQSNAMEGDSIGEHTRAAIAEEDVLEPDASDEDDHQLTKTETYTVPVPTDRTLSAPLKAKGPSSERRSSSGGPQERPGTVKVVVQRSQTAGSQPAGEPAKGPLPRLAPEPPRRPTAREPGKLKELREFWGKNSVGFAGPQLGNTRLSKVEAEATLQRLIAAGGAVDFNEVRRLRKLISEIE